jgi:hypothetical protein
MAPSPGASNTDAVHREIVGIRALSIHAELSLAVGGRGSRYDTRRKQDYDLKTPAIQGKIFYE